MFKHKNKVFDPSGKNLQCPTYHLTVVTPSISEDNLSSTLSILPYELLTF